MKSRQAQVEAHLILDDFEIEPAIAHRLPPMLAFHYHALPVAAEDEAITVAMADPTDKDARQAVSAALGVEPCIVQGDPTLIERTLSDVWPEATPSPWQLLIYTHHCPDADLIQTYAGYLARLLHGQAVDFESEADVEALIAQAGSPPVLVVFGEPKPPWYGAFLRESPAQQVIHRAPASVLIARRPRWPLRHILLIIRSDETDEPAVNWLVRLARPAQAAVTVLAVLPPMPALVSGAMRRAGGLGDWLTTDTHLGRQLRRIARRLTNWAVDGRLQFRPGAPEWQIRTEVQATPYDLVIIAADPPSWLRRRVLGSLVAPLLGWLDRPVLVTKAETKAKGAADDQSA